MLKKALSWLLVLLMMLPLGSGYIEPAQASNGDAFSVTKAGSHQVVKSGTDQAILSTFTMSTATNETLVVEKLSLQLSIGYGLKNVFLTAKNGVIGQVTPSLSSSKIQWDNLTVEVQKNAPVTFQLKADIDANLTVSHIDISIPRDGIQAKVAGTTFKTPDSPLILQKALFTGDIDTRLSTYTPDTDALIGDKEVLLGEYHLKALGEDITLASLLVNAETSSHSSNEIEKLHIRLVNEANKATTFTRSSPEHHFFDQYIEERDRLTLGNGYRLKEDEVVKLQVLADTNSETSLGNTVRVSIKNLNGTGNISKNKVLSQENTLFAKLLTFWKGPLFVTLNKEVQELPLVKGEHQKLGSFRIAAGYERDVVLRKITFDLSDAGSIHNLYLQQGTRTVGSMIGRPRSTGNIYHLTAVTVPKNESLEFTLYGDIVDDDRVPRLWFTIPKHGVQGEQSTSTTYLYAPMEKLVLQKVGTEGQLAVNGLYMPEQTFYAGQNKAKVAEFELQAYKEDITLQKLQLNLATTSKSTQEIENFSVYMNNSKVYSKNISPTSSTDVHFFDERNDDKDLIILNKTIAKGQKVQFTVYADIREIASSGHQLQASIKNYSTKTRTSNTSAIVGTELMVGPTHTIGSSTLSIEKNPGLKDGEVRIGVQQHIGSFRIQPLRSEESTLEKVRIELDAYKNLRNLTLKIGSNIIAEIIRSPGEISTFIITTKPISKDALTTIDIYGDVLTTFDDTKIEIRIPKNGIVYKGKTTKALHSGPSKERTLQKFGNEGELLFSQTTFQPQESIPVGGQDVQIAEFYLRALREDITIGSLYLNLNTTSRSSDEIERLRIFIENKEVYNKKFTRGDTGDYHFFDSQLNIEDQILLKHTIKKGDQDTMKIFISLREDIPEDHEVTLSMKDMRYIQAFSGESGSVLAYPLTLKKLLIGERDISVSKNNQVQHSILHASKEQVVASFFVGNGTKATHTLEKIRINLDGYSTVSNMFLRIKTKQVSQKIKKPLNTNLFTIDDVKISPHSHIQIDVVADIQDIKKAQKLVFSLPKDGIVVRESEYSKFLSAPKERLALQAHWTQYLLNIIKGSKNTKSIQQGKKNIELANYSIKAAGEDMELRGLQVTIPTPSHSVKEVEAIKIKIDGKIVAYKTFKSTDTFANHYFDNELNFRDIITFQYIIPEGTEESLKVLIDTRRNTGVSNAYTAYIKDVMASEDDRGIVRVMTKKI